MTIRWVIIMVWALYGEMILAALHLGHQQGAW
jgi:hypothetical protein